MIFRTICDFLCFLVARVFDQSVNYVELNLNMHSKVIKNRFWGPPFGKARYPLEPPPSAPPPIKMSRFAHESNQYEKKRRKYLLDAFCYFSIIP